MNTAGKMDIIHLPERNDESRHRGLEEHTSEGGPSFQDIINSMRSHLLPTAVRTTSGTDPGVFIAPAVGTRNDDKSKMPRNKNVDTNSRQENDSIMRMLNGQHATDRNQRGLTEEEIAIFNKGAIPVNDEEDEVVSISSARLCTPFYEELRKKYPQAFLRKRNSLGSNLSETSSHYGGDTPRRVSGTPRSARTRNTPRAAEGELPPKAPNSARLRRTAGKTIADFSDNEGDSTISGVSRRGAKTGRLQGILKNSRQYSSTLSLQNENVLMTSVDEPVSNLTRSDSNSSLKERLKNHQQSWKSMFSEGNSVFSKIRRTVSTESLDSVQETMNKPLIKPKPSEDAYSRPLNEMQNKMTNSDIGLSSGSNSSQKRSTADSRGRRREAQLRRFASPDSSHDSAVEMDNGSVRSGRSVENKKAKDLPNLQRRAPSPAPSQSSSRGRSPSRPRTPKLKSQSRSSSPMIANGFANDSDSHSQAGSIVQGMSESDLPGFTPHYLNRDSDADSGIIQGARGQGSVSSNDDDAESVLSRIHPSQKLANLNQSNIRRRSRRGSDASQVSQKQGPVRANHAIPVSAEDDHKQNKRSVEAGGREIRRDKGPRTHKKIYGDPGPPAQSLAQRSRSADRKRERVTFEDEVLDTDRTMFSQRTGSQPDLNIPYIAPPPDFAGSNGDLSRIPMYDEYDMDYNSPRGYLTPRLASEQNLVFNGLPPEQFSVYPPEDMDVVHPPTPTRQLVAAAMGEENLESSMELHRASPVVVNQNSRAKPPAYRPKQSGGRSSRPPSGLSVQDLPVPPPPSAQPKSPPPAIPADLNSSFSSEVAFFNGFLDDVHFDAKDSKKKSKLPWKKNKGRYTPTIEIEKLQQMGKGLRPDSRSGSWSSLHGDIPNSSAPSKPPTSKKSKSNSSQPVPPPRRKTKGKVGKISIEHIDADRMSQFSGDGYEPVESMSGRRHSAHVENAYEEVDLIPPRKSSSTATSPRGDDPSDIYSVVKKPPRPKKSSPVNNPAIANTYDSSIEYLEPPPLPQRGYESDLERHRGLGGSQASLTERLGSFRDSAKKKFNQLRKSLSLEKLDKTGKDDDAISISSIDSNRSGRFKKSPSLRSFTEALGIRKEKKKVEEDHDAPTSHRRPPRPQMLANKRPVLSSEAVEQPKNFRSVGKVRQLNPDGTQVIELTRPPHGPFGFYIARGNAKFNGAIFVSRLSDGLPESFFVGLLGVGDEIIEINGQLLRDLPLEAVYDLMKENNKLVLKTLPYVARKEK